MPYTCKDHPERTGEHSPQSTVQDGWTPDGRRIMREHQPVWGNVECGHMTSEADPECTGCRWRGWQ